MVVSIAPACLTNGGPTTEVPVPEIRLNRLQMAGTELSPGARLESLRLETPLSGPGDGPARGIPGPIK